MKINALGITMTCIFINEGEKTGYEMAKRMPNQSHQQIYRELKLLNQKGVLNVKEIQQSDKPNKKVYSIVSRREAIKTLENAVSDHPIHNDQAHAELEAISHCIGIVPDSTLIEWISKFISHHKRAFEHARASDFEHETELRRATLKCARWILAKITRENEPSEDAA